MKKRMIAAALVVSMGGLQAQTASVNIATTAVPFLRISPDARAGGMGDMGVATPADANSPFHNLAKTAFATQRSAIAVNYTPWMHEVTDGVYLATVSGYHQLDEQQAVGMGFRYFNLGDYGVTDYSGNKLGAAHPREFALDGGYTRKLSSTLSLALAFRYIHSDLASGTVDGNTYKPGNAMAADVSLYYQGASGLSAGLVLSNLGTKIGYTDDATMKSSLPTTVGLGVGYTATMDEVNQLTFEVEANHLLNPGWAEEYQGAVGVEYAYDHLLSLRTGYHVGDKAKGDESFFTAGMGLRFQGAQIDLSYLAGSGNGVTRDPLSNTVRLGLSFALGKTK